MAEQICDEYKDRLPIVLFRPAIVTGTESEPIEGWMDNLNGPFGILVGSGTGLMRTFLANDKVHLSWIPVDSCVKGMITAAWRKSTDKEGAIGQLPVYNCVAEKHCQITYREMLEHGRFYVYNYYPFETAIWYPGGDATKCKYVFYLRVNIENLNISEKTGIFFIILQTLFTQLIPSIFADFVLRLLGKKPL